jgi:hypothetical protein
VEANGILSEPGRKMGRSISSETTQLVKSFYLRDDISRPLPGRKDVVSVVIQHEDGRKEKVAEQKRLVLGTLGLEVSMQLSLRSMQIIMFPLANSVSYSQSNVSLQVEQAPMWCVSALIMKILILCLNMVILSATLCDQ